MGMSIRWGLTLSVLLAATESRAQQPISGERPRPFAPLRPESREDLNRREARCLYALGMLRQRQDRLVDALRHMEEARALDPEAAAVQRGLVPLYQALGRSEDALAACRQALDREPDDYETWYTYAHQLHDLGRDKEALAALNRGVACPSAKDRLELLVQMHFDRGVAYEEAGDLERAESAFNEVVSILVKQREALVEVGPFNPEQLNREAAKTYERIGQICIKAGRHDRALVAFQQAQKRDPESAARLNYNLAEVCLARDKPDAALPYLDAYLRTEPAGDKAYRLKIAILKRLKRDDEILPALRRAAERDGHNVPLQLLLARQYVRERQWAKAETLYLNVAEESPERDVYRGLLTMYVKQAREQGAGIMAKPLNLLDQAVTAATPKENAGAGDSAAAARARGLIAVLRNDPALVKVLLERALVDLQNQRERGFETWRLLGALAAHTHQTEYAERLYRHCLDRVTPQTEAEVYGGLLEALIEGRKFDEVVQVARDGLRQAQATNRILFHVRLAPALAALGKADEALASADEAVKLADDRNRARIRRFRVDILRRLERYDQAIAECQTLLKESNQPGDIRDIRYSLSNVYSTAKAHAKAEEQLRLILQTDPNDATANNDLGYIMADQGKNLEESERLIRKAIELDRAEKKTGTEVRPEGPDDNAAYLDSLGWVLFRRGQFSEARQWLEKAIRLPGGSDDPVVWDHLGDVYFRQKEPARARTAWEKAVRLYEQDRRRPADERYKEAKRKLQTEK